MMVKHTKGILNPQHLSTPRAIRDVLESQPPIKLKIIEFLEAGEILQVMVIPNTLILQK